MKKFILTTVSMVFGLALFSGCVTTKGQTTGEYIDDSTMTTKVNAVILKDADAHYFKIDVTTTKGDVILQGIVNSRETEGRLVANVWEIKGVKSVKSLLKLKGETAGEYLDDSVITTKVNGEILKDADAHYLKIDVTSSKGEVVLQGFVNSRRTEARLIAKIRELSGVKSVQSFLKIQAK